jgi:hypothetical protein
MDGGSYRDDNDADQPETYWRRRAITLAAGLTLLGLLAWAFSGGGGKAGHPAAAGSPAATTPAAQYHSASPEPSAAASASDGADAAVPGLPSAGPSGLPTAAASSATPTAKAGADPASTAPVAAQSGGDCSPSSVVLSLFSTRPSYSTHELPEFDVYAVSTAPGTCTLNLGSSQLHLTVMSAGRVIWDSSDCSRGEANRDDQLSRGVPVQTSLTWNRAITLPGCVMLASSARAGTYQAQVKTGTVASQVSTFKLVG